MRVRELTRQHARPRRGRQLALAIPTITLVLAFTAIPAELRPPRATWSGLFDTSPHPYDVVVNVIGYVPMGAVLATHGWVAAAGAAAATSGFAEASQLFARGRETSLVDFATNVIGALLGWALARRWRIVSPRLRVTPLRGGVAAVLAVIGVFVISRLTPHEFEDAVTTAAKTLTVASLPSNDRGADAATGRLEARWTFDARDDGKPRGVDEVVTDASGSGVNGVRMNGAALVPGIRGEAVRLDGSNQYVDLHKPVALRLAGSMTISAWINASSFPASDAVVVSSYGGFGYQLDTTVDQGPRTIAFRFTNAWGGLTSRYGATPLKTNAWYHIAGVLDVHARTLSVFLNGELDNGCLAGVVTGTQTISPDHVYIGRPAGAGPARAEDFSFAGAVDDVRIYSRALSRDEIREEMREASGFPVAAPGLPPDPPARDIACRPTEPPDPRTGGVIVAIGVLVAVGAIGLWPSASYRRAGVALSLLTGILMAPTVVGKVPGYPWWLAPVLAVAGGIVVSLSTRSTEDE